MTTRGRKTGRPALHLRGGSSPKRTSERVCDWTAAMRDQFIETLADTCNVTLAAASIGRSIANAYKWRERDATFRASWDRALAMGYSRLELMLLERARHGVEKVTVARDGEVVGDSRTSRPGCADAAANAPRDRGDGRAKR